METLVVVNQHRNQYYGRVKPNGAGRYGSSPPSRNFRDINCRAFQSGAGILPTPSRTVSSPVTKRSSSCISISCSSSPKTPSPSVKSDSLLIENPTTKSKSNVKSKPIAINLKTARNGGLFSENISNEFDSFSYSELWAGPAYSNSPPPSSLPIPKFSMRPKRTVSLELPVTDVDHVIERPHPLAKSAPASPTRERGGSNRDIFLSADSATKTLRRILNLDNTEE